MKKQKIIILGSTGSIGENAVKVIKSLPERFEVCGIAAKNNINRLAEQAAELNCRWAVTSESTNKDKLAAMLPAGCKAYSGEDCLNSLVTEPDIDTVLCAIVGTGGLMPVINALRYGKKVALASKEVLVMAGELVMGETLAGKSVIIPVDSEHSAIFQCLEGRSSKDVARLLLTASGGPFRDANLETLRAATYEKALAHPTWNMGEKVSIDSATLMNKALEIVEAGFLFKIPPAHIDVVIHPQSVIHSMVEFIDHSILAQMSIPDMRFPIQYALTWPEKCPGEMPPLDFTVFNTLSFALPDRKLFPSLDFAYHALQVGGTMPAVMNAANEIAVEKFKSGAIGFTDIWQIIETTMDRHQTVKGLSLDAILDADKWARRFADGLRAANK